MDGCLSALMPVGPLHAVADRLAGDGCKMLSQVSVMVYYARWNVTLYSAVLSAVEDVRAALQATSVIVMQTVFRLGCAKKLLLRGRLPGGPVRLSTLRLHLDTE